MTDKQIIIDGCNVSECECLMADGFDFPQCRWEIRQSSFSTACEQHSNCCYKQLKRKEQECEELKRQHQGDKGLITTAGKMNYQLLQEYDKHKEAVDGLLSIQYKLADSNTRLRQTLTEIKEIAKYFTEKGLEPQSVEHQLKLRGKEELAKIILQKISEVEDEHNG